MKKAGLAVFFLLVFTGMVSAQSRPSVTIVNDTGYTVYYLYLSQTATDDWEEDVLGDGVLYDGYEITVTLAYPLNVVNRYDIMIQDEDGDTYTKWNVLLKQNMRIVFTLADLD